MNVSANEAISKKTGIGKNVQVRSNEPLRMLRSNVDRVFDRVFDDFWQMATPTVFNVWSQRSLGSKVPSVDVKQNDNEIEVIAEMPGLQEDDIEVTVNVGALTINGESVEEQDVEEGDFVLRERSIGKFERTIPLPDNVDLNAAKATFKDGLLSIKIPKTQQAKPSAKKVEVKHA